jgi:hypothetical protein
MILSIHSHGEKVQCRYIPKWRHRIRFRRTPISASGLPLRRLPLQGHMREDLSRHRRVCRLDTATGYSPHFQIGSRSARMVWQYTDVPCKKSVQRTHVGRMLSYRSPTIAEMIAMTIRIEMIVVNCVVSFRRG